MAAIHGELEIAQFLIDAKADVNPRDEVRWILTGVNIGLMLLRLQGMRTPLVSARSWGHPSLVELLIKHGGHE